MEVVLTKKAVQQRNERQQADADNRRLNSLSLYSEPPAEDVTLEDFEDFAVCRLRGE